MKIFQKVPAGGYSDGKNLARAGRRKKIAVWVVLAVVAFVGVSYVVLCLYIGSHVKSVCAEAMREYPGDRVDAVIAYVESESHSLKERNKAVWALGYLGDKRALPVLKKYYSGEPCEHDKYLCQGELAKAIKKCESGVNPCAWACR